MAHGFLKRVLLPGAGGISGGIKPFTVIFYELLASSMPFYEIANSGLGIRVKQAREERTIPCVDCPHRCQECGGSKRKPLLKALKEFSETFLPKLPEPTDRSWGVRGRLTRRCSWCWKRNGEEKGRAAQGLRGLPGTLAAGILGTWDCTCPSEP